VKVGYRQASYMKNPTVSSAAVGFFSSVDFVIPAHMPARRGAHSSGPLDEWLRQDGWAYTREC
jgi:hypothetical protein